MVFSNIPLLDGRRVSDVEELERGASFPLDLSWRLHMRF